MIAVVVLDSQDAAIVELNSETDFVARSEDFKSFARELAEQVARRKGIVETVLTQDSLAEPGKTVQNRLEDVYTKLREKIVFKRFEFISTDENGVLAGYVHVPANDKIGVLVELEAASPEAAKSEAAQSVGARTGHADRRVQAALPDPRGGSRATSWIRSGTSPARPRAPKAARRRRSTRSSKAASASSTRRRFWSIRRGCAIRRRR